MDTAEVGGPRIAYRRAGSGPVPCWCTGLGDSRDWRSQLAGPSDERTVVAWVRASDDPPETFRLADFADCLAGFVAAPERQPEHVGRSRPSCTG